MSHNSSREANTGDRDSGTKCPNFNVAMDVNNENIFPGNSRYVWAFKEVIRQIEAVTESLTTQLDRHCDLMSDYSAQDSMRHQQPGTTIFASLR